MKIKTIIWDFNGTLLDDLWLCVEIINKMLVKRGLKTITQDQYQHLFNFPVIKYYKQLGFDFNQENYTNVAQEFINTYIANYHKCRLHPLTIETLKMFQNMGIQQTILSVMEEKTLIKLTKQFKIQKYFSHIYGTSNFFGESKMKKAIELINKANINVKKCILIGDTIHDIEVANHIACKSAIISHGHFAKYRFNKYKIPIIENFSELKSELIRDFI